MVPVDFLRIWLGVRWAWGTELAFLYLHVVYPRLLQLWSCNNVVSSLQFILYKYYYSDANYPIPGWFRAQHWVSADFSPFLWSWDYYSIWWTCPLNCFPLHWFYDRVLFAYIICNLLPHYWGLVWNICPEWCVFAFEEDNVSQTIILSILLNWPPHPKIFKG